MDIQLLTVITILICIPVSYQQSTLSVTPLNQAAVLDSDVTFQCQVNQNDALTDYISWEECITTTDDTCARISNDGDIVYSALGGDNDTEARYSIEVIGSKQFNLMISGITAEDAGQYRCLSRNNVGAHYSAELVVLDSEPVCECNTTDDTPSGLPVYVSCQVDYYGIQSPEVVFMIGEDKTLTGIDGTVVGSANGHMEYNITHLPEDEDMCKDLYAKTKFSNFLTGDRIASNAPTYEYLYTCFIPGDGCFTTAMTSTLTTDKPTPTIPDSSNTPTPINTTAAETLTQDPLLSQVAIIGIGVGGGVIIFVVVIIIIICVCKKQKHKQTETGETTPSIPMSHQTSVANENDENNRQERNPNQIKNLEGLTYADLDLLQHIGPHPSRPAEQTAPHASRPTHEVHIGNSITEYADIRMK